MTIIQIILQLIIVTWPIFMVAWVMNLNNQLDELKKDIAKLKER